MSPGNVLDLSDTSSQENHDSSGCNSSSCCSHDNSSCQIKIIDTINFESNLCTKEKEKLCEEREEY